MVHWLPLSSTKAMLTYMSVFHHLLRSPTQSHVLQFNCLPLLHFQSRFLITLFRPGNSLFLHHSVLCLDSPWHPTAKAKPHVFNPKPIALYIRCSGVQTIITHLAFQHNICSFFIHFCTKTEIISSMHNHNDQHPNNKSIRTFHSCIAAHSSSLIFLFKKHFPSLGFLTCVQCRGLLPLPRTPTTKVLG